MEFWVTHRDIYITTASSCASFCDNILGDDCHDKGKVNDIITMLGKSKGRGAAYISLGECLWKMLKIHSTCQSTKYF